MLTTLNPYWVCAQQDMKLLLNQDPTLSNESSCIFRGVIPFVVAFHLVNHARFSPSSHCGLRPTGKGQRAQVEGSTIGDHHYLHGIVYH